MTTRAAQPSTKIYGPAARRKGLSPICQFTVLHQCIQPAHCVTGNAFVTLRPSLKTVQVIEANLLASAIASTLRCNASRQLQSMD
jgi:hypothetical protein